jgi:hypothetical protein
MTEKNNFLTIFLLLTVLLFEGTFTSFFKDKKVKKKSQSSRNQGFSCYFCMRIEGSGSGRPNNMWIRNTVPEDELEAECLFLLHPAVELADLLAGGLEAVLGRPQVTLPLRRLLARLTHLGRLVLLPGLAMKNPP